LPDENSGERIAASIIADFSGAVRSGRASGDRNHWIRSLVRSVSLSLQTRDSNRNSISRPATHGESNFGTIPGFQLVSAIVFIGSSAAVIATQFLEAPSLLRVEAHPVSRIHLIAHV
jgi:hypothetical protein